MTKPFSNYSIELQQRKFDIIRQSVEYYNKLAFVDLITIKVAVIKTTAKYKLSRMTFFRYKKIYHTYLQTIQK